MGTDKTNAGRYSQSHINFVKSNFSEALIFMKIMAISPKRAMTPRTMQNGIHPGTGIALSNEIAIENPNNFKRHSVPRLKNAAFTNIEKGKIINKIAFFIPLPRLQNKIGIA